MVIMPRSSCIDISLFFACVCACVGILITMLKINPISARPCAPQCDISNEHTSWNMDQSKSVCKMLRTYIELCPFITELGVAKAFVSPAHMSGLLRMKQVGHQQYSWSS